MLIPENEQGVIVLFAQGCQDAEIKIVKIQAAYPDAIIEKDGKTFRVEFEYLSSNFTAHRHDPRECDLIVCWQNDNGSYLPTIELSDPLWTTKPIPDVSPEGQEAEYWKQRALNAEAELNNSTNTATQNNQDRPPQLLNDLVVMVFSDEWAMMTKRERVALLYQRGILTNLRQAEKLSGVNKTAISRAAKKMIGENGIDYFVNKNGESETVEQSGSMEGAPTRELAETFGTNKTAVSREAKRLFSENGVETNE